MANISVRNLDPSVHAALQARAREHGRSMEAEIRQILADATRPTEEEPKDPFVWLMEVSRLRGGVDLELPPRTFTPPIDFSGDEYA